MSTEHADEHVSASGRRWARAAFIFGATCSLGLNLQAAWLHVTGHAPYGQQAMAAAWPIILIFTLEVMSRASWPAVAGWRTWGWLLARFGGFGAIGATSAVISYTHVHAVLIYWGYNQPAARAGAVCLDGLMVLAGFALLAASKTEPAAPGADVSASQPTDTPATLPGAAPTDPGTAFAATVPGSAPQTPGTVTGPTVPGPTAPGRGAQAAELGSSDGLAAGGPGHLSVVPDTSGKPRVSAAGQGVRPLVSVRADSAPDSPPGHPSDTPGPDTRTPASGTPPRTPGHQVSGQADHVSGLLLSGHSVRAVAAATGHPRSTVQDRRTALVAAGQLPPAKGSQ